MAFDGIIFINGPLKIRRPKDYGGMDLSASPGVHVPGVVSTNVPDTINKVFVGGLPTYLNEEQVMELLKSFGELKAFNLVRENGNGPSKANILCSCLDDYPDSIIGIRIFRIRGHRRHRRCNSKSQRYGTRGPVPRRAAGVRWC